MNCVHCGKNPFVSREQQAVAESREITFVSNGVTMKAKAKPYSDAFYEIVEGKHKGNLVHTFDLIK